MYNLKQMKDNLLMISLLSGQKIASLGYMPNKEKKHVLFQAFLPSRRNNFSYFLRPPL